jgi:hypothetical protein
MPNIFEFLKKHYKLLLSWRFIAIGVLLLLAVVWFVITQVPFFDFVGLKLESLPLYIYITWFILVLFSFIFAFCMTPYERYIYKKIKNSLNDIRLEETEELLFPKSIFKKNIAYLPKAKIKFGLLKVGFYKSQFELVESYRILQEILKMPLLPFERVELEIELMKLLYKSGNIKVVKNKLDSLKSRKLSLNQKVYCLITEAELYLFNSEFQKSKDLLEEYLIDENITTNSKIMILHTIGIAETQLQNFDAAITIYRQTWNEIKKIKNFFGKAEITIDNLIFTYLKLNKQKEAKDFLNELNTMKIENNIYHQVTFSNIKLNIARQLNDRVALLENYQEAEKEIFTKLTGETKFAYIVNSLRMHWNDGVDFEKAFKNIKKAFFEVKELTSIKRMNAIKEVLGTVKQALRKNPENRECFIFYNWLVLELERLEPEIDKLLEDTPVVLPSSKRVLISFKIEIIKNKIAYMSLDINLFESLFNLLKEQVSLWQGMQNPMEYLHELMIIIDDYIAYKEQFQLGNTDETKSDFINKFESKFLPLVTSSLNEAEKILEGKENNIYYLDKLIGFSYFYYCLNIRKDLAKRYIKAFEESKQSEYHFAKWLREQYIQVKEWIGE